MPSNEKSTGACVDSRLVNKITTLGGHCDAKAQEIAEVGSAVTKETIKTPDWVCGGPSTAMVYSPNKAGKFPVISFAHGLTAGGNKVDPDYGPKLLEPLAAAGYVVIATMDAPSNYCE